MSYYGWKPYVSVVERQTQAAKAAAKAKKSGKVYSPIVAYRGALAKTVWGKQWCDNLEAHSDYANRLPRGRSYVRNGSVIDLNISAGLVQALVMGSSLYKVKVTFSPVGQAHWQSICKDCSGSIASLVEILQGKLSTSVMQRLCQPGTGLMPIPQGVSFDCSCPDWAGMCKHVAAVLYGVGARLDHQPELLFTLRHVDAKDLVQIAGSALAEPHKAPIRAKVLDDALLVDVFSLDMASQPEALATGKSANSAKSVKAGKVEKPKVAMPKNAASQARAKLLTIKAVAPKAAVKKAPIPKMRAAKKPAPTEPGIKKEKVTGKKQSPKLPV